MGCLWGAIGIGILAFLFLFFVVVSPCIRRKLYCRIDYATWALCLVMTLSIPFLRHRAPAPLWLGLLLAVYALKFVVITLKRQNEKGRGAP